MVPNPEASGTFERRHAVGFPARVMFLSTLMSKPGAREPVSIHPGGGLPNAAEPVSTHATASHATERVIVSSPGFVAARPRNHAERTPQRRRYIGVTW